MVEFISYNGEYPNLCSGLLVIKVNGKLYELRHCLYSSGQCFSDDDYNEVVTEGDWGIRNHCKYQCKTGDDCISCLLSVNCNLISRVEKPLKDWENVREVCE